MPVGERITITDLQMATTGFGQFALECNDVAVTIDYALDLAARTLKCSAAALIRRVDADRVEIVRCRGAIAPTSDSPGYFLTPGADLTLPSGILSEADRLTKPLVIGDWQAAECLAGSVTSRLPDLRSSVLVRLTPQTHRHALVVVDTEAHTFQPVEIDALVAVSQVLSAAMDRHRREAAQAAVAAFGEFALESRSVQVTLQRAVELVTAVLGTSIGFVSRLVAADLLEVLYGRGPLGEPFGGETEVPAELAEALRSAEPFVTDELAPWQIAPSTDADDTGAASLIVAVRVSGDVYHLGVTDTEARRFVDSDLSFLSSIAHLVAAALKRDRTESQLRDKSSALQRALLPAALPVLEGIESAARYVPSGHDQVGGDWYDVLALPNGAIGLVMGDVEGHDIVAAAIMGQVRNVLRAYVAEGHPPADVLSMVNDFVTARTDLLVSCCYAELRPTDLTITCVSAGHPAPLVLGPDGTHWQLPVRQGLLLGVDPSQDYQEQTSVLPRDCHLLMVTDGLVDDVGDALYPGVEPFAQAAAALVGGPLDQFADRLVARAPGAPGPRDDAALLAVRVTPPTPSSGELQRDFTPFTSAVPAARRYVADVLTPWDVSEVIDSAVLAVSELVTNAVMHTTSSVRLLIKRLEDGVWIGVHDSNDRLPTRPAVADDLDPGGRGLAIVEQIADRWGIAPTPGPGGKLVWLELVTSTH